MMVVDIAEGNPSRARSLIDPWPFITTTPTRNYDVLEDGSFMTSLADEQGIEQDAERGELQVVLNFFEVLRQRIAN